MKSEFHSYYEKAILLLRACSSPVHPRLHRNPNLRHPRHLIYPLKNSLILKRRQFLFSHQNSIYNRSKNLNVILFLQLKYEVIPAVTNMEINFSFF